VIAPAAVVAISSSPCALAAPLTATAPTISPSTMIGTPPRRGVKSLREIMGVRPALMRSSNTRVGHLKIAAVRALPIEIGPPAGKVLSSRSTAIRLPPSSTTAITPVVLRRCASSTAAAMTRRAPSRSSDFLMTTSADARLVNAAPARTPATSENRLVVRTMVSFPGGRGRGLRHARQSSVPPLNPRYFTGDANGASPSRTSA
jgi:hypothetical protein